MSRQSDFEKALDQAEAALSNARGYFDDESTEASELRGLVTSLTDENATLREQIEELNNEIEKLSEETR